MAQRISCYTLFNITQTGVMNRSRPQNDDVNDWINKRNTQCNFDTILQVISLRSQPEVIKIPTKFKLTDQDKIKFGFVYNTEGLQCWKFEFEIQHHSVFGEAFSALYKDCDGVPMITCEGQHNDMPLFLNTSVELRNIYFEVI